MLLKLFVTFFIIDQVGKLRRYLHNKVSSIIVNELKDIEVSKRPLHCCDSKRDVIYIKDKDVWEPDNQNNDRMKNAIQLVANKCVQNIKAWENDNPNYLESGTTDNDNYNALIKNSIGSMEAKTKERES